MAFTHVTGYANLSLQGFSWTFTLNFTPTPGNLVCVAISLGVLAAASSMTVTDSNNNSYTVTPHSPSSFISGTGAVWLFYLLAAPSNATNVLHVAWVSTSNKDAAIGWAEEFSYSGTCFFDKDTSASSSIDHTTINTPSITPTKANSLLYACASVGGTVTHPKANATLGAWTGSQGDITGGDMAEYDLNASATTSVDFTQTPTQKWSAMAMAFYTQPTANPSGSWMFFGVGNT